MGNPAGRRGWWCSSVCPETYQRTLAMPLGQDMGSLIRACYFYYEDGFYFAYVRATEVDELRVGQDERLCAAQCHYLCVYVGVESKEKM